MVLLGLHVLLASDTVKVNSEWSTQRDQSVLPCVYVCTTVNAVDKTIKAIILETNCCFRQT